MHARAEQGMLSNRRYPKFGLGPCPQGLIRALAAIGCVRMSLTLAAGSGHFGASFATGQWFGCAGSLILLALLDRDVQEYYPGVRSLCRCCSYVAIAGSSLLSAAGQRSFLGLDAAPAFAAALTGLALTLGSAMLLRWALADVCPDGPLPSESALVARLTALKEVLAGSAWRTAPRATMRPLPASCFRT